MKFAVSKEHRDFFEKNKGIEFENILSQNEIKLINDEITQSLMRRLSVSEDKVFDESAQRIFEAGRDLWRESESIKKVICHRRFGELVYQLVGEKPIRIGYDQYYPPVDTTFNHIAGKYTDFIQNPTSLKELSSLQGIVCGLLIALKDTEDSQPESEGPVFPHKSGNAVALHPDGIINWPYLLEGDKKEYYLVVYAIGKSIYTRNRKDPLSGSFIQLGYSSGDRLNDVKNPIIFR